MIALSLGRIGLQSEARKVLEPVEEISGSGIDWLLLAAAIAILLWLRAGLRARTRIGPVEVGVLQSDSAQARVYAVTAVLRKQLEGSGFLPAPAVPAGTPQANLVEAVAASPIPQRDFIAALIKLLRLPQPRQYTLSGTLLGTEGDEGCGFSFWLRPAAEGRSLLLTVMADGGTHEDAVRQAAFEIYLYISREAGDAFPTWTRWSSVPALQAYRDGCRLAREGAMARAILELHIAAKSEPGNALVPLQLANLYEQQAEVDPGLQADALRRYVDVASAWPCLVQARYRASVLAGVLTSSCKNDPEISELVHSQLNPPKVAADQMANWLEELAKAESAAASQMLKWWYVPLRHTRTRNQFEPSASERRELKRALEISRQCLRVRLLSLDKNGWPVKLRVHWSEAVVHVWHLVLGSATVDWQSRYLAACFDALLLERAYRLDEPVKRHRALRERALRQLRKAIAEAGGQLSRTWVEQADPDLWSLREPLIGDWELSLGELPEARMPRPETQVPTGNVPQRPLGYPARPWPNPRLRAWCWLGLALASLAGAIVLVSTNASTAISLGVLLVVPCFSVWRSNGAKRDTRFS